MLKVSGNVKSVEDSGSGELKMKGDEKIDADEKEEPVCPVCKMSSCRGALGYKCEFFQED